MLIISLEFSDENKKKRMTARLFTPSLAVIVTFSLFIIMRQWEQTVLFTLKVAKTLQRTWRSQERMKTTSAREMN